MGAWQYFTPQSARTLYPPFAEPRVSLPPDFDRIAELNKRLDAICREAEELRAKIETARHDPALWPERWREVRTFAETETPHPRVKPEPT
jgi:hypothetical protein